MSHIQITGLVSIGAFDYAWPTDVERFEQGWEAEGFAAGQRFPLRYGLTDRVAYGRVRRRGVAWAGGAPMVEGVEADDFKRSEALVSGIRRADNKFARSLDEVPPEYRVFEVVDHRAEIDAPYSRRIQAVKIPAEDAVAWMRFGLTKVLVQGTTPMRAAQRPLPATAPHVAPSAVEPISPERKRAVIRALLDFAAKNASSPPEAGPVLTSDPEANELVLKDPFAFLLAVIADQNIPYEKAWRLPFNLKQRLGHLDPERIATEPESVRLGVQDPPVLHRYKENVPAWIVRAAEKVIGQYGGDASRIWSDSPTARELQRRFDDFTGIGQKKAAMAVEILNRDLKVDISEMEGSDIAYDIHVRRVFLRTGLVDRDDMSHMIEVARGLHPERPGALDLPAWMIGLGWCHPGVPDCPACPLTSICPKLVERGSTVV